MELALTISVLMALLTVLGLAAVPWGVRKLPADFFSREPAPLRERLREQPVRVVLQNLLGLLLVLLGVALLVLPGQGLLTLLIGILLTDLPVRDKLLRWLARREPVARLLQALRRRGGCAPFAGLGEPEALADE